MVYWSCLHTRVLAGPCREPLRPGLRTWAYCLMRRSAGALRSEDVREVGKLSLILALLALGLAGPGAGPGSAAEQAAGTPAASGSVEMTPEEKADADIGKSADEAVAKQFKMIKDSPALPRITAIVDRLRPVTQKPHLSYQVKVVDSKAINAFSLPGGYLYFTQGLLDAVESDDELAAVAGHEMAHVCLGHSRKMMSKNDRYNRILGPIVLGSILSRSSSVDPGAIAMVGSLVVEDALNHYGRGAELEADHNAVLYLNASKVYNPVAMLTVAEGLARLEGGEAPVQQGVFQTHPYPEERIAAITSELNDLKIPIERRRVTKSLTAVAVAVTVEGREIGELRLTTSGGVEPWSASVFQPAVEVAGNSPLTRAQRASDAFNRLLLSDLRPLEVTLTQAGEQTLVQARGQTLFAITPEDADFHKSTVEKLAQQAMQVIQAGFQQEKVGRAY